jgi:hypothetical protein
MPNYDFQSLSSYDFELLARDLVQAELGIRLESFAPGPDGGIDFRFKDKSGDIVVQCKHYKDYEAVYQVLKREEALKVRRLRPKRYILALSTPLTPPRKDAIFALFEPYCRVPGDIFGREDLNNLLTIHGSIEQNHVKLWLTSEPMLRRFLDRGVWGDSELTLERIRQQAYRYVPNPSLRRAQEILNKHHYCIIVGIPGIGKTTLAEILLIDYADRHGFQAVRIANDLSEVKGVKDPRRRQIFYYDDFLGTRKLDKLEKNEDKRIVEFMQQVAANTRWRFILTTREYILNTAMVRYESLAQPPVELSPCIVDLADYTRPIRAQILYNHIFFSDLPDSYKLALLEKRRYSTILGHANYNPRIVEFMTQFRNVRHFDSSRYFDEFVISLANPVRIWDHAFRNDLSEAAQHILMTLGSMPTPVILSNLRAAFDSFYEHRRKKIGFSTTSRDFEHAIKELDGNFVRTDLVSNERVIDFHNPSVNDYIDSYLGESPNEIADLLQTSVFFEQFQQLWSLLRENRSTWPPGRNDDFVAVFSQRFMAPSCRGFCTYSQGQLIGTPHSDISFERRMAFALEIDESLGTQASKELLGLLVTNLGKRIEAGEAHKAGLLNLLPALDKRTKISKSIFASAQQFLTGRLEDFEDFSNASNFVKKFPGAIADEELDRIRQEFYEFSRDYADIWDRDPDVLRSTAEDITAVGQRLQIDVSDWADPLFQKADEMERERESEPEPEDSDRGWPDQSKGIREVDLMFEGLLREIAERAR